MSDEVFSRIIEELLAFERIDVIVLYHGGEPFLNKKIFKMIQVLKSIEDPFIKINTNGMLLLNIMAKIIKSGINDLYISLDGLSPEENNSIRRGSDYHRIVFLVKKLLLKKTELHSKTPNIYIANTQIPIKTEIEEGIKISTPQYILNDFSDFKGRIKFKNTYMIKWPGFNCLDNYDLIEMPGVKDLYPLNYCDHIISTITVRWNGDIVPCCYDIASNYVIGNIMKQSLSEIWNNEKYKQLRKSIHLRKYLPLCIECKTVKPQLFVVKK